MFSVSSTQPNSPNYPQHAAECYGFSTTSATAVTAGGSVSVSTQPTNGNKGSIAVYSGR